MINERVFAIDFGSYWGEIFPMLTPSLVAMLNASNKHQLIDECGIAVGEVEKPASSLRYDLISECTFYLANILHATGDLYKNDEDVFHTKIGIAMRNATTKLSIYQGQGAEDLEGMEVAQIKSMLRVYRAYFLARSDKGVVWFEPEYSGAGFIPSCFGDFRIGSQLVEVKAVARNLHAIDIKQLVTYLALQWARDRTFDRRVEIFNPRRALTYNFDVIELIDSASGGREFYDVFESIVLAMCSRGVDTDSAF